MVLRVSLFAHSLSRVSVALKLGKNVGCEGIADCVFFNNVYPVWR